MKQVYNQIDSPVGPLTLLANDQALLGVHWGRRVLGELAPGHSILRETESQLKDFFSRERTTFDLPLEFSGTDFQTKVWRALQNIPYAETRSYLDLARKIGSPKACRAVGAANGRNPLAIVVPCHRVIGTTGKLTGFAGGLAAKTFLLDLEKLAH